jgi:hypothetical protein
MGYYDTVELFKKQIETVVAYISKHQNINSLEEYKFQIGIIHGLNLAIETLTEQMRVSTDD